VNVAWSQVSEDLMVLCVTACASVAGVGSKVFQEGGVPQNQTGPYVVVERQDSTDFEFRTHTKDHQAESMTLIMTAYSESLLQAIEVSDALKAYFSGLKATQGSTNFASFFYEDTRQGFDLETRLHSFEVEFSVTITNGG